MLLFSYVLSGKSKGKGVIDFGTGLYDILEQQQVGLVAAREFNLVLTSFTPTWTAVVVVVLDCCSSLKNIGFLINCLHLSFQFRGSINGLLEIQSLNCCGMGPQLIEMTLDSFWKEQKESLAGFRQVEKPQGRQKLINKLRFLMQPPSVVEMVYWFWSEKLCSYTIWFSVDKNNTRMLE